ncbi:MAG: type II toxin-antitoxin system VapC family toxin [Planctomycetes bacterium]|nr:type II toxin-antitoxin system VapC family toxin [Planctomycetota bacterium]
MKALPKSVLDASALLAFLLRERGFSAVKSALHRGAAMSAVNWAEVLSKLSDVGRDPEEVVRDLTERDIFGRSLAILPFDEPIARDAARLRSATISKGLSLGDRACIATGRRFRLPVLTADKTWESHSVEVEIRVIR